MAVGSNGVRGARRSADRRVGAAIWLAALLMGCGAGPGAPTGTPQRDAAPDAPPDAAPPGTLALGVACAAAGQCASGFCADGVCCATDCAGICQTCAALGSAGVCQDAEVGTDPRGDCVDTGATNCGTNGVCDGAGSCQRYPRGVTCQQAGCNGGALIFAGRCDGLGTCAAAGSESCAPYTCGPSGACSTACASDADCVGGAACVNGGCGKSPLGAACAADADCNTGFCAEGACCMTACDGLCQSCALPGSAGLCTAVPDGQDPLDQCADSGAVTCGTDGLCDGAGTCRDYPAGTSCGAVACTAGSETPAARCDGVGDCVPTAAVSCTPYVCGGAGDCQTTCASDTDCAAGLRCNGSICCTGAGCALAPLGAACAAGSDCAAGFCQQGVCCASSCSGTCQSCALSGSAGACSEVPVGLDPLAQCDDTGAASCGTNGACDGAGNCQLYAAGTICAAAACSGGAATAARTCDGVGTCQPAAATACAPYACNAAATACTAICAGNTDCAPANACNATTGSCGLGPNGATCSSGETCNSGICAQGVCCASACAGLCSSCAITGSLGTCVAVPAGQDPLAQCSDSGAASCGTNGFCNGSGACQKYAAGTGCAPAACTGATLTAAAACDGNGTCATPAPTSCAPYLCGAGACKTTCSTDADCATGNTCTAGTCGGGCPGVYCDNFESDTVGASAVGWTREGGSSGDWQVISDATKAFAQNHAQSATFRLVYPPSATGAPWTGATSVSASVKVLAAGSSGTTTALICLRYTGGASGDYACLVVQPGTGARIQMRNAGAVTNGPLWSASPAIGTWATVGLSVSAAGALTATLNGATLGAYTPATPIASGYVALATQSAEAAFDNIVVTQP